MGKEEEGEKSVYIDWVPLCLLLFQNPDVILILMYGFIIMNDLIFVNGHCSSIHTQNGTKYDKFHPFRDKKRISRVETDPGYP